MKHHVGSEHRVPVACQAKYIRSLDEKEYMITLTKNAVCIWPCMMTEIETRKIMGRKTKEERAE